MIARTAKRDNSPDAREGAAVRNVFRISGDYLRERLYVIVVLSGGAPLHGTTARGNLESGAALSRP